MTAETPLDCYAVLGVPRDATLRQVKAAYRKLAKRHHPDACPGDPEAAARFRDITDAYTILSDPVLRQAYDRDHPPAPGTGITVPGDSPAASRLLAVLEDIWTAIRRNHPEVPPVVIIIACGTDSRQPKWGHYASGRWYACNVKHAEVMISGEGLARTPARSSARCCTRPPTPWPPHAASPAPAARAATTTRNTPLLAKELGLDVAETPGFGWTITTVPDATASRYAAQLAALKDAMTLWRNAEHIPRRRQGTQHQPDRRACPCGRNIRVAASTLDEAPITCQACDGHFEPA